MAGLHPAIQLRLAQRLQIEITGEGRFAAARR
jgi:hypothetical protein